MTDLHSIQHAIERIAREGVSRINSSVKRAWANVVDEDELDSPYRKRRSGPWRDHARDEDPAGPCSAVKPSNKVIAEARHLTVTDRCCRSLKIGHIEELE